MNELEALAKKEEQEKLQQDQLREQVIGFEQQSVTSDVQQRTAFRDKAIEYQRNYEASLIQDMNAQTQRVEVRQGPPDGDRPLEANAAEESWKEKRSRIKEEKKRPRCSKTCSMRAVFPLRRSCGMLQESAGLTAG